MQIFRPKMLAICVSLAVLVSGCNKEKAQVSSEITRPVKIFEVTDVTTAQVRNFPATVTASNEAEISFRVPGKLIELNVSESQIVEKGELLAKVDDTDARNSLADQQATYELSTVDYRRKNELLASKAIAQSTVDHALAQMKSAKAALELARSQLAYTKLVAPFKGRVARVLVENHQYLQAQQSVLLLQSDNTVDLHIQMPEQLIASLNPADVDFNYQPVVRFDAIPGKTFKVRYKERSNKATVGTQSYDVVFTMSVEPDMLILPGMAGILVMDMTRVTPEKILEKYVVVPRQAVAKDDATGETIVWKYNPDTETLSAVNVTMGRFVDDGIQIISGLEPGDHIIAAGASQAYENMKVKPLHWERGL